MIVWGGTTESASLLAGISPVEVTAIASVVSVLLVFIGKRMTDRDARKVASATIAETLTDSALAIAEQHAKDRLQAIQERNDALEAAETCRSRTLEARAEARRWRHRFEEAIAYIDLIAQVWSRDHSEPMPERPETLKEDP